MKLHQKVQVWIVNRTSTGDRVLLLKVIPKRGGGWHPITGSVEPEEVSLPNGYAIAARRETEEETGIKSSLGQWVDLNLEFEFDGRWGRAKEHAFAFILSEYKGKIVLDPSEHLEMKWVPIGSAAGELGFESQRSALEAVSCYLLKRDE